MLKVVENASDDSDDDVEDEEVENEEVDQKAIEQEQNAHREGQEHPSYVSHSKITFKVGGYTTLENTSTVPEKASELAPKVRRSTRNSLSTDLYVAEAACGLLKPRPRNPIPFAIGDKVFARYNAPLGKKWYVAHVFEVDWARGTVALAYVDGDKELRVSPKYIMAAPNVNPDIAASSKLNAIFIVQKSHLETHKSEVVATIAGLSTTSGASLDVKRDTLASEIEENERARKRVKDDRDRLHARMSELNDALKANGSECALFEKQAAALAKRQKMQRLEALKAEVAQLQRELA